jgi:hypothetical protein
MAKTTATRPAGKPAAPTGARPPAKPGTRPAGSPAAATRPAGAAAGAKPAPKPAGSPPKAAGGPAKAPSNGAPPPARRGLTGQGNARPSVKPRTRRNSKKANASPRRGLPPGDYTMKFGEGAPQINLVQPSWSDGSLIFRPFPAWNPEAANEGRYELDPYRFSTDELDFSDFYRKYPAVSYLGFGDEAVSFLLFDPNWDETEYDKKSNPFLLIYNAIKRAVKRDFSHPEWLPLISGSSKKSAPIPSPCDFYYFQGAIFKRGADIYVGRDRSPKGLGQKDWTQVVRLKNSAGSSLVSLLNAVNAEWEGDPSDFENSMIAGDPVSPEHGRFITVYNPKKEQLGGEDVTEMDSYEVGADGGVESTEADDIKGYRSRIDDVLMLNGRRTKINAHLNDKAMEVVGQRIVFWDDIINIPNEPTDDAIAEMHANQMLWIARALKACRKPIEFALHDHPELLTADVKKILTSAKQVSMAKKKDEDEDLYEDATEPIESATLGDDIETEFAESEDLDAAAEYEEVVEGEEGVAAAEEYEEVEVAEGEEYEEVEVAEGEEYEEVEVEEGEELAEGEEYEEVEVEEGAAEEYEEVEVEEGEELAEGEEYEEVEVEEGEEGYDEEYEEVEVEEESPEGDLDVEEDAAREALEKAQSRAGNRAPTPPQGAPTKKTVVKKSAPAPAAAAPKKAAPPKKAPPPAAPKAAPKKAPPPAAPKAAPKKAPPPAAPKAAPKKAPPPAAPKKGPPKR